jgi:outer membrane protein assembly factor BamB
MTAAPTRFLRRSGCLLAFLWLLSSSRAETNSVPALDHFWPQWRGPLANGVAPFANPPIRWSETENIRWKVALPGKGHSSPILLSNAVYVLAATPVGPEQKPVYDSAPGVHDSIPVTSRHQYLAMALSRLNGRILWQTLLREEFPHEGGHVTGSPLSNSPISDGESVYAFLGSRGLYALNLKGEIQWQKDLGKMQTLHAHGEGSSPALSGDTLVVNWDHEGDSFLFAFDKRTGRQLWKTPRDEKTSWSTPLIVEVDGKPQVIVSATKRVRGYDLTTGKQIWECAGLTENVVASPVYTQGILIAGNSYYQQSMVAIRLAGAAGDITKTDHLLWSLKRNTPYVSSPLLEKDTLYVIRHNQNVLARIDPLTGHFGGGLLRLDGIRDFIFSSPVAAAGRIYVTARDGVTVVLKSSGDNSTLAINKLNDSFSASAALIEKELYLRGEQFLYCIAEPSR